ncbi:ATP-binding cassette domain-containing protein [Lacticaseibacillus absianus]|uniref:ATP-binding cassette domain-containing protein n=1 Tax=Lacticaseibacillus absianus TaxID=2729623 RepID=UPI0015C9425B|nr:ATP-binding cassette domain-containing protein [Lacticaseibacillus absianus]
MTPLTITDLTFSFGAKQIFDHTTVALEHPGIYGLVAPNGSGKTTLLRLITRLLPYRTGDIQIMGQPNTPQHVFQNVAFLPSAEDLALSLTGKDYVDFIASSHKVPRPRVKDALTQLEAITYYKKRIGDYSLGMKQRLLLALILMQDAPLVLMDEPLNGLDFDSLLLMRKLLRQIDADGRTLLLSTHNLPELAQVGRDALFLEQHVLTPYHFNSGDALEALYRERFTPSEAPAAKPVG